jgi:hypothetical protein
MAGIAKTSERLPRTQKHSPTRRTAGFDLSLRLPKNSRHHQDFEILDLSDERSRGFANTHSNAENRDSQQDRSFMYSVLVTASAGRKRLVGNLEEIAQNRCPVLRTA